MVALINNPLRAKKKLPVSFRLTLSFLLIVTNGCAHQQQMAVTKMPAQTFLNLPIKTDNYQIQANDLLRVHVLEDKTLDRQVRVENDGTIQLPLIATLKAAGLGVNDLEKKIADAFQNHFIKNPHVSVFVDERNGNRITVTGAVMQPGLFEMKGQQETLQQAVAEAKGVSQLASRRNIIVFRERNGQKFMARFDLNAIEKGRAPDPVIQAGDIVVVIRSSARTMLQTVVEMTPFVMVWRAYR